MRLIQRDGSLVSAERRVVAFGILEAPTGVSSSRSLVERVVSRGRELASDGADGLDLRWTGTDGEGPARVEGVGRLVRALRSQVRLPILVTTTGPQTAEAAVGAGASILAVDVQDEAKEVIEVAAGSGAVLLVGDGRLAVDRADDIVARLREAADVAVAAGMAPSAVWLEVPSGGGARAAFRVLPSLAALGFPLALEPEWLATPSETFDGEDRWEEAAAVASIAIATGALVMRVRDVKRLGRVARMAEAICRAVDGAPSRPMGDLPCP